MSRPIPEPLHLYVKYDFYPVYYLFHKDTHSACTTCASKQTEYLLQEMCWRLELCGVSWGRIFPRLNDTWLNSSAIILTTSNFMFCCTWNCILVRIQIYCNECIYCVCLYIFSVILTCTFSGWNVNLFYLLLVGMNCPSQPTCTSYWVWTCSSYSLRTVCLSFTQSWRGWVLETFKAMYTSDILFLLSRWFETFH